MPRSLVTPKGLLIWIIVITIGHAQDKTERVADTKISIDSGFYAEIFAVTITTATAGATILYTTDGSEPDLGNIFSGATGEVYTAPIPITHTTTLRVRAFAGKDLEPTNTDTRTYLFLDDVIRQSADIEGWPRPVLSIGQGNGHHDYEMDPRIVGEGEQAEAMKRSLLAVPTMSLVVDQASMWNADGNGGFYRGDTEEAVHVEVLYPTAPENNERARGAVRGHSHDRLKRSLRLSFKAEFGDTKFPTRLLQQSPQNNESTPDAFDRLILRAGNNRSWARSWNPDKTAYTMDEWFRATQIAMSGYGARGAFVHLYINGLYWGLYNVTERPDRWFTTEHFGGNTEDWFAISHGGEQGGESDRWNALLACAREDLSAPENYREFEDKLDASGFIDYLLGSWYINVTDWPQNNWWAGIRNEPSGKARFFAWDGEWSFGLGESPGQAWVHPDFRKRNGNRDTPTVRLWNAARENSDFMMLVSDRAYKHLVEPNGALTDTKAQARWALLNAYVNKAVLAESARWGDAVSPNKPRTVEDDWQAEVDRVNALLEGNGALLIERLKDESYYPNLNPPLIDRESGFTEEGTLVSLTNPNGKGDVYITLDGTDPRASGGTLAPTALQLKQPVQLSKSTKVKGRVLQPSIFGNQTWSALTERQFYTNIPSLRISEIMYHPADPSSAELAAGFTNDDDFEFLELVNTGATVIHLNGMTLTTGILFVFDSLTLQPNEYAVVVSNRPAFTFRYGASAKVLGEYQQHLGNGGDHIELTGAFGEPILSFTYEDQWHKTTDGEGPALEVIALQAGRSAWEAPQHWRASTEGGSPGLPSLAMPTNQRPRLNAQRLSENQFSLELIGTSNSTYIMEWSPDLKSWTEHSRETTDASGLGKVTIHLPPNGATTYYRARESSSARLP